MKRSYVAALVTAALGLLSMGFLGAALYALALPVLWPLYGDPDRWSGDNVWPAMIGAGVLWSISFVVAGRINRRLEQAGWSPWPRRGIYVLVLWLGAALSWILQLQTLDFPKS